MDSKTRAKLRSLANNVQSSVQIGKTGLTDGIISQIDMNLKAHELVKIDVLETAMENKQDILNKIVEVLGCEIVACIGRKIIVYKYSTLTKKHVLETDK